MIASTSESRDCVFVGRRRLFEVLYLRRLHDMMLDDHTNNGMESLLGRFQKL